MNQVAHTMLIAQALASINARIASFMDLGAAKIEGRAFMEAAAGELGLKAAEGREAYDAGFPEFQSQLLEFAKQKAQQELTAALHAAQQERERFGSLCADLKSLNATTLASLSQRHKDTAADQDYGVEYAAMLEESYARMVATAQKFSDDMLAAVRMKHRLALEHCFTGHLVDQTIALKLVDVYDSEPA